MSTFLNVLFYILIGCFIIFVVTFVIMFMLRIFKVKIKWFDIMFFLSLFIAIPSSIFALINYIDYLINGGWSGLVAICFFWFIILPSICMFLVSILVSYFYKRKLKKVI